RSSWGYILRLGKAQVVFFSADERSNVVGATAHIALEFDEAQDIAADKHDKEFMPMGATTNCTKVYYGTAWDDTTLLERVKQENLELERKDGIRRHFEYPWWVIAEYNEDYGRYVESERQRLGESHPLFRTQYKLESISGTAGLFSSQQLAQMRGDHPRRHCRGEGDMPCVAGIDIAGEDEEAADVALRSLRPKRDSTVVTIAALDFSLVSDMVLEPKLLVQEHYYWTGHNHRQQYEQLLDLLRNLWCCRRVVVDSSGIGAGIASFLVSALGASVAIPFVFSASSKSRLAYGLLSAVNGGRFKMYAGDGSEEYREFWQQCSRAKYSVRANQLLNFYVPEAEGHDDFVISAALCVEAAAGYRVMPAATVVERRLGYEDGRY
ncbi:MAG: hypothetical protein Q8P59_14400, partial [Dehalococcoidia bacterium]|nr:hypothetical protein [Dehalococcoidia bacterium]